MKPILFALLATAGLATTAARADRVDVQANVNFGRPAYGAPAYGGPAYGAPVYNAPAQGYWREVPVRVWVAPHWDMVHTPYGHRRVWSPGRYEMRHQRVWQSAYAGRNDRGRWDRDRHDRRDYDDRRGGDRR